MNSQLLIEINYSDLTVATSSLENSLIFSILYDAGKLSENDIIFVASKDLKSLGIFEDRFKANIGFYLNQLISVGLIEFKDGEYSITNKGRKTYALIDMPLKHVLKI